MPSITDQQFSSREKLWFFALAIADIGEAEAAARAAVQAAQAAGGITHLYLAFVEIATIRYVRPFKACRLPDERASVSLPRSFIPEKEQQFHEVAINIRDKVAAHSDMSVRDVRIERMQDRDGNKVWSGHTSSQPFSPDQIERLANLCAALQRKLLAEIRPVCQELFPDMLAGETRDITL